MDVAQIQHCCGCSLAATALIQPLPWELPYPLGVALKRPKKEKETKQNYDYQLEKEEGRYKLGVWD